MQKIRTIFNICFFVCVIFLSQSVFGTDITISQYPPFPANGFPYNVLIGHEAIADFLVTNNLNRILHITDSSTLPPGGQIQLVQGAGYCGTNATLQPTGHAGSTCILGLRLLPQNNATELKALLQEYVHETGARVNYPWAIYIKTTNNITPDMPTLSAFPSSLSLAIGVEEDLTVTNLSTTQTANDVKFTPPLELANQLTIDDTTCTILSPGASCIMKITANNNAIPGSQGIGTIQGANTQPLALPIAIEQTGGISAAPVFFSEPGNQNLTMINDASIAANVTAVYFAGISGIHNVGILNPAACPTIPGHGGSCNITLSANDTAYGNDNVTIEYTLGAQSKEASASVAVANTLISVESFLPPAPAITDSEIQVENGEGLDHRILRVNNIGNFILQYLSANFLSALPGVAISNNTCAQATTAIGGNCTFQLDTNSTALPGSNAILQLSGNNTDNKDFNVVVRGGLAMIPVVDSNHTHLSYKAIKVENETNSTATFKNITETDTLADKVDWCPANGTNCDYKSTCVVNGTLPANQACYIWLRAFEDKNVNVGNFTGNVTVTVESEFHEKTKDNKNVLDPVFENATFPVIYSQDLYVGGYFDKSCLGGNCNSIAKWNGSDWYRLLGSGLQPPLPPFTTLGTNALTVHKGDLYVGGIFQVTDATTGNTSNNIARWNGNDWFTLGETTMDSSVYALASWKNTLYVGGFFTLINGNQFNRIAKWIFDDNPNNGTWANLGIGINNPVDYAFVDTFTSSDTYLYVGGNFREAGGLPGTRCIARWNDDNNTWEPLGYGTTGACQIFSFIHRNEDSNSTIYAGGVFDSVMNVLGNGTIISAENTTNLAKWKETDTSGTWSDVGNGLGVDNAVVYALGTWNNDLYVSRITRTTVPLPPPPYLENIYLSKWSLTDNIWNYYFAQIFSSNGYIFSLTSWHNYLYTGGDFRDINNIPFNHLAKWDGISWSDISGGIDGNIRPLLITPSLNWD